MGTTVREVIDYLSQFPDDTLVALLTSNPRTGKDCISEFYKGKPITLLSPGNYTESVDEYGDLIYLEKKQVSIDESAPNKIIILG